MIEVMDESIHDLYKQITTLKDAIKLSMIFPETKQAELLETLMEKVDRDQDDKTIFLIVKLYLHFVQFGAEDEIKQDALTCLFMIKSFSIRQDKQAIQHQCFLTCFRLIYARFLTDEQKSMCLEELNEFYESKKEHIRWYLIVFYFDDKHNPYYNILKIRDLSDQCFQNLCDCYAEISMSDSTILPLLPDDEKGLAIDTLEQRFYNQFVYGEIGLHAKQYNKNQARYVIDTLIKCAKGDHGRSQSAKKGLIKHLDFLANELQNTEQKEDVDSMIAIQDDIDYIKQDITTITFGKLEPQLQKVMTRLNTSL